MNYFVFGELNSKDFNVFISGENTFLSPERDVDIVSVPGKNGTLSIDNGRFNNVQIKYPCAIVYGFRQNYDAFKAAILAQKGYKRLADSYDVDHFRKARFVSSLTPEMTQLNRHGQFDVIFDCDPRRFLKEGEKKKTFTATGTLLNPTRYVAAPLIRLYGSGTLTIGSTSIVLATTSDYVDIDCELEEALDAAENLNITTTGGKFPKLSPGENEITFTGTKFDIVPRFYTV